MIKLGLDIGSRNTKLVIFDSSHQSIMHYAWLSTDISARSSALSLVEQALSTCQISQQEISATGVTGYGRKLMQDMGHTFSEISCHAVGCHYIFPGVRTVIDIGGQDSKLITLGESGKVADFAMNDKCAAGTGRFLEMTALRLGCEVSQLSALAAEADQVLQLNSTCVVFAESEIINMMASSTHASNIARAVHQSIVQRIQTQMAALAWQAPVVFTGGVAQNSDLALCLGKALGHSLLIPPEPEITGALGAAILAK